MTSNQLRNHECLSGRRPPANRRCPTLRSARDASWCPMTPQPEIACVNCGGGGARNGKRPNKYCDKCVQVGIEAGARQSAQQTAEGPM